MRGAEVAAAAQIDKVDVRTKASHRDLVTEVDVAAESAVRDYLRARRPTDAVLGEEAGVRTGRSAVRWLIDPIDGTANFVRGRPDYAVAVAGEIDGQVLVGVIVKPATGEWMACDENGRVTHSGNAASVSRAQDLSECLVSVSVSIDEAHRPLTLSTLTDLLPRVQDFRRTGSTSCDLLAVATGRLDAYVGVGSKPWDIAPGWALVNAAGGRCLRLPVAGGQEAFVLGGGAVAGKIASIVKEHAATFAARSTPRPLAPQPGLSGHQRPGMPPPDPGMPPPEPPRAPGPGLRR